MILPRLTEAAVRAALDRQAAVALIGPRQVGKTTLARGLGDARGALYLDVESREDRDKLARPRLYLERLADRLVIWRTAAGAEIDLLLERPDGRS